MKKLIVLLILASLFLVTTAIAEEPVPARYMPILESWNATNVEELYMNILEYYQESVIDGATHYTTKQMPLNIRFGGTTEELIADKANWDLAIVSSKEVDLQALADLQLINLTGYNPSDNLALHQRLLPENLQALLPSDPLMMHYVYVYDYDVQADDATLMICQNTLLRKKSRDRYRSPGSFAGQMLRVRSVDAVRSMEGIRRVDAWTKEKKLVASTVYTDSGLCPIDIWTEEDLIANAEDWDVAIIRMDPEDKLKTLDAAGLLFDLSAASYLGARTTQQPYSYYCEIANGIFSTDGRMIGIPHVLYNQEGAGTEVVLIVNAKSSYLELALDYAVHFIKSKDWYWTVGDKMWPHGNDICMYKDEMDW
ncbi:MAG: hypothetical protein GX096_11200 [Clostridiales bacterium]|nr:hypothetical protein [Clostridiales bacterium]